MRMDRMEITLQSTRAIIKFVVCRENEIYKNKQIQSRRHCQYSQPLFRMCSLLNRFCSLLDRFIAFI